jgi:hypothetical protein
VSSSEGIGRPRLSEELDRYLAWLRSTCEVGEWDEVVVVEDVLQPGSRQLSAPVPATQFGHRFDEILELGTRDWVNLTTAGVIDNGNLVVVVEYFPEPRNQRRFRPEEITVMFSGPPRRA